MFEIADPWILTAMVLPPLVWFLIPRSRPQFSSALKVPFYSAILAIVSEKKDTLLRQKQVGLLFFIWCLLVFAAAGPRWVGEPRSLTREGRNIMMALDLSGSMELADMLIQGQPVSRLEVVKAAAKQFVRARVDDRIGLILFGTRAYLQTPLTYDKQSVLMRLDDATVGLAGQTTSIGDAIGLAVKRLQDVPIDGRVIVLLTDGANNSGVLRPLKAAELAKLDHIKIYTIGLGSESDPRALGSAFFSPRFSSDLDEETLEKIAKMTGGQYFRATDTESLQTIYETINQLETNSQDQTMIRPQQEYYPWPLGLALFLWLYCLYERTSIWQKRGVNL